jgi:YCII-related domain-containing protein
MSSYVLIFRMPNNSKASPGEEAAWGAWFQELGGVVEDFGHRVGQSATLGTESAQRLGGYVVISADDIEHATQLAKGCPGLQNGGSVEIGESVPM